MNFTGTETLEQLLQGMLPGVMVMNQSGLTGMRQKVRVRRYFHDYGKCRSGVGSGWNYSGG
ncbi:MAG: hypothetical protein ACLU4J_09355 [Butyricimonas paravirosa]